MNMNMLLCYLCCCRYRGLCHLLFVFSDFFRCKDRLCFSAVFEMNPEAEVLSSYFAKAWILLDSCCMHLIYVYIYIILYISHGASKTNASKHSSPGSDSISCSVVLQGGEISEQLFSSFRLFLGFFCEAQERLDAQSDDEIGQALQHLAALARKLRAQRFEVRVFRNPSILRCRWNTFDPLTSLLTIC